MFNPPINMPATRTIRTEKAPPRSHALELWLAKCLRYITGPANRSLPRNHFPDMVIQRQAGYADLDDEALKIAIRAFREQMVRTDYTPDLLATAFALVREVTKRTFGVEHYPVQLMGGYILFSGNIAEMQTGEGKSLTALLPACAAALKGIPVHVITVNDYLAQRDATDLSAVYRFMGLSVGCIVNGLTPPQRRSQYDADVVYCTNNEVVFDYLKDSINLDGRHHPLHLYAQTLAAGRHAGGQCLLRGLHYAIVDEVDSVLMDEARTPLIISGEVDMDPAQEAMYRQAVTTAAVLVKDSDYRVMPLDRRLILTESGKDRVYRELGGLGGFWKSRIRTYELITQALVALHLFERDRHYLVRDEKIMIIDEHTGRVMENRSWERGLHQMIEIKEQCPLSRARTTLAKISYQGFFRKYHHLCGMTGTAREVMAEFRSTYGLHVIRVPVNTKSRRIRLSAVITADHDAKWDCIVARISELYRSGHAVLIGTHDVSASESLSRRLNEHGLPHELLNAKQDNHEAEIVSRAGNPHQITIATNMAGRGTDIKLSDRVKAGGGLHVILTELHDAGRIDRQLEGRCARQGDPGVFQMILSLDDHLLDGYARPVLRALMKSGLAGKYFSTMALFMMKVRQKQVEGRHHRVRSQLLKQDSRQEEMLTFSGRQN